MAEWWDTLITIEKILYCIAVPSTIILIIQTLFIIFGGHGEGFNPSDTSGLDFDNDFSGLHGMDSVDGSALHGIGHGLDVSGHDMDIDHNLELNHSADIDHHQGTTHDSVDNMDSFRLFTIQGIVGFFCMFSWSSIAGISNGMKPALSILIGFVLGFILMYVIALIIRYSYRLAQDGTFNIREALGNSGTVYLTIPADRRGQGKVNVMVSERMVELNAMTDEKSNIDTGEAVRITDIINDFVIVERDR